MHAPDARYRATRRRALARLEDLQCSNVSQSSPPNSKTTLRIFIIVKRFLLTCFANKAILNELLQNR